MSHWTSKPPPLPRRTSTYDALFAFLIAFAIAFLAMAGLFGCGGSAETSPTDVNPIADTEPCAAASGYVAWENEHGVFVSHDEPMVSGSVRTFAVIKGLTEPPPARLEFSGQTVEVQADLTVCLVD